MKKFNLILLSVGIVFCFITLSTPVNAAGTKEIGDQCVNNDECITQKCAPSTLSNNPNFCVCNENTQCSTQYGVKNNETWSCEKGEQVSHGLAYCKSSQQGAIGIVTDTDKVVPKTTAQDSQQTATTKKTAPPTATVSIPGAEPYTEVTVTPGEIANIPWIAQYIRGAYSYGIRLAAIIAVMMLMIGGILMISAGMNSSYFNTGKSIVYSSLFGIILLASSYLILNTINPKLVTPAAISLDTIEADNLEVIEYSEVEDETAAAEQTTPDTKPLPPGKEIAVKINDINEVTADFFTTKTINTETRVNGWTVWQSLSNTEKAQVLPYLYKQVATCEPPELVNVSGIPGWSSKKIHPQVLPHFQKAASIAKSLGFKLSPGSVFRDASAKGVPLWNTGVVARYRQWKTGKVKGVTSSNWKTNQGKISKPTCKSPHQSGGAIDVNLVRISDGKRVLAASSSVKITAGNYARQFSNNPYKVILEYIMNQAGFVRYCGEHWHFEYGVSVRYKNWDKQARCWGTKSTIDQPIPTSTQEKVTRILGKNIF